MRVFISCSHDKADQKIAKRVKKILVDDVHVLAEDIIIGGTLPRVGNWRETIKEHIARSDVVIGLFSQRGRNTKGKHLTVPWVIAETSWATALNKIVLTAVEDKVDRDDTCFFGDKWISKFSKKERKSEELRKYVVQNLSPTVVEAKPPYTVLKVDLTVQITEKGAGVHTYKWEILCVDKNRLKQNPPQHVFAVIHPDEDRVEMGEFYSFWKIPSEERFNSTCFRFRFLDPRVENPSDLIKPIEPPLSYGRKNEQWFTVNPPDIVEDGKSYTYEYMWSAPNAYITTLEKLKENPYEVCKKLGVEFEGILYTIRYPIRILEINLEFDAKVSPNHMPRIFILDQASILRAEIKEPN